MKTGAKATLSLGWAVGDQDARAHLCVTPPGRGVVFTSSREGSYNVYEASLAPVPWAGP